MPTKTEVIEMMGSANDEDNFVVRTKEEDDALRKNIEDNTHKDTTGKIAQGLEDDIEEITGIKKESGVKYYEHHKRVLKDLKSKIDELKSTPVDEALRVKYEALEKKLKEGGGEELEAVRTKYNTEKEAWEADKTTLNDKLFKVKVGQDLSLALVGIKFKPDVDEKLLKTYVGIIKNDLTSRAVEIDGEIVYKKKDGSIELNDADASQAKADYLLIRELKDYVDAGKIQNGTGLKNDDKSNKDITVLPANIKTPDDLTKHIIGLGFANGTKEHSKIYAELRKKMK